MARIRGNNATSTAATATATNSYEEARRQHLEENKKKLQELGILSLTKSLSEATNAVQKSLTPKIRMNSPKLDMGEVRRSTRARNSVSSYSEEFSIELPRPRKRPKSGSWTSYLARPADEVKFASYEERVYAQQCAENFQCSLQSGHPSFVKSMVRSHVYSCFWLGLPVEFCQKHLPSDNVTMVLEDPSGSEYDSIYKGEKRGLSGGWRGFALDHKLDDGDALVFELTEPERFKVYIFKARDLHRDKVVKNSKTKSAKDGVKKVAKGSKNKVGKHSEKVGIKSKKVENDDNSSTEEDEDGSV